MKRQRCCTGGRSWHNTRSTPGLVGPSMANVGLLRVRGRSATPTAGLRVGFPPAQSDPICSEFGVAFGPCAGVSFVVSERKHGVYKKKRTQKTWLPSLAWCLQSRRLSFTNEQGVPFTSMESSPKTSWGANLPMPSTLPSAPSG